MCGATCVEHGSSAVEYRPRNRERPGSNAPFATVLKLGHFRSTTTPQFTQMYK